MSITFTDEELKAIRAEYCKGATDTQFELFISECRARSLRPGVHLVWQARKAKEYDSVTGAWVFVSKAFWITTIAALRLIAQRTGDYLGQGPEEYIYLDAAGNPTIKSEIPLPHEDPTLRPLPREPWVARATVYRKGFTLPMVGMARFEAYATVQKTDSGPVLTETWRKRGSEQLFKCAEALAFRKAYPEEMSGLLLAEELKDLDEPTVPSALPPMIIVPPGPVVPKVDQTPAVPTETPRPNERQTTMPAALGAPYGLDPATATKINESMPALEKFLENTVVQQMLTEEGKKVDHEEISRVKAAALAAVPGLKPASELPEPKKRGRKSKSPENGRDVASEGGITQTDIDNLSKPAPEFDEKANQLAAQEFVESVSSFTPTEAATQGLPDPKDDAIPEGKVKDEFIARMRGLVEPGVDIKSLGDYTLALGGKTASKFLTVGNWKTALGNLEEAKSAGTLKQLVKGGPDVPMPTF